MSLPSELRNYSNTFRSSVEAFPSRFHSPEGATPDRICELLTGICWDTQILFRVLDDGTLEAENLAEDRVGQMIIYMREKGFRAVGLDY